MAKAFLIRWGFEQDFGDIKLQAREPGFAVDSEKLYIGTGDKNVHFPNEDFVSAMISDGVIKYKPMSGTTLELATNQISKTIAYNTDTKRLQYKTASGTIVQNAAAREIPTALPTSVVVQSANIDIHDGNSVTLAGITRPLKMVFLNGRLCSLETSDIHELTVDAASGTIKVKECVAGDIIAYF